QFAAVGRSVMRRYDDPLSLDAVEAYFRELYWVKEQGNRSELDAKEILERLHLRTTSLAHHLTRLRVRRHCVRARGLKRCVTHWMPLAQQSRSGRARGLKPLHACKSKSV